MAKKDGHKTHRSGYIILHKILLATEVYTSLLAGYIFGDIHKSLLNSHSCTQMHTIPIYVPA